MYYIKQCKVTVNKRENKKKLFFFVFITHHSYFWILFSIFYAIYKHNKIVFT